MKPLIVVTAVLSLLFGACKKELTCPGGEAPCNGACAALATDTANCGACGFACAPGVACLAGVCACPPGRAPCNGSCASLQTEPDHCGACGITCAANQVCSEGACAATCATGLTDCGRACADLATDRDHCGACGVSCEAGASCVDGACRSLQVACFSTDDVRTTSPDFLYPGAVRAAGVGPISLAAVGTTTWVASSLSHGLTALPAGGGAPVEHLLASANDLEGLASFRGALLVSNSGVGTVLVYDPAGARIMDELSLGGAAVPNPRGVAFVGDRGFVALYGKDEASGGQAVGVLDLSALPACLAGAPGAGACGTLAKTIDLLAVPGSHDTGGLPFPSHVVAVGEKVYVTLANLKKETTGPLAGFYVNPAGPAKLAVIDTAAADAVSIVDLGACQNAGGLSAEGTAALWVACADSTNPGLLRVDLSGQAPAPGTLRRVAVGSPGNLAFCGSMGYVTDLWSGKVLRFDPAGVVASSVSDVCPVNDPGPFGYAWAADVLCSP